MTKFSQLGLSDPILKVLNDLDFETPTAIQSQAIPMLLEDLSDFIGMAQTGTGKTAAFGLPLLDKIDTSLSQTQALILAPTRELVQQIGLQLEAFAKYIPKLKLITVYGGAPIQNQIKALKSNTPHILLATPGRLLDLMNRKVVNISELDVLVLDEADEMLNMGFKEDIDHVLSHAPEGCKTWLFSATMPPEIRRIISSYMSAPKEVKIAPKNMVNQDIAHHYCLVHRNDKTEALIRIIDSEPNMIGIVFCRTKVDTQRLADDLNARGYMVEALHGDLNQNQRDRVMGKFKSHKIRLVTATDVAARGIDVKDLTHVIHHSLPDDQEYYTHRSGRTARGGQKGISIALATRGDLRKVDQFAKKLKVEIKKMEIPSVVDISFNRINLWADDVLAVTEKPEKEIVNKMKERFTDLSKSDLLERVIALEINKLNLKGDNLNVSGDDHLEDLDHYSQNKKKRFGRKRSKGGGQSNHHKPKDGAKKEHHGKPRLKSKSKRHLSRRNK